MFTTMCALYAAGFESRHQHRQLVRLRAQMRDRLRGQNGPAVDAVRQFYGQHESRDSAEMLSRYVWFGIVSGPAPKFQPLLRRDELPPDMLTLEGFSEILSAYYTEQKIGQLLAPGPAVYDKEIRAPSRSHLAKSCLVRQYLSARTDRSARGALFRSLSSHLVARITNVRISAIITQLF